MTDRRAFLKAASGTAGAIFLSPIARSLAQTARREIHIGSRRATTVDIHAHCVFPEVADILQETDFADVGFAAWQALGPDRLEVMNERGIDYQALSINRYWWYGADRSLAADIVRIHDEGLATWVEEHPDRFVALTSPALQFPDLAAEQLEYAVNELGHRGASVGGSCNGENLSDPRFDPFWAKAEELGAPVFMHPGNAANLIREGAFDGRGDLGNIIGNPLETAHFLARLMFDGTLDKFPGLKVVGAHGGGYLPSYLMRFEVACEVRGNANCASTRLPSEYLRDQILADSMVFSHEGLRHLVAEMGAGQIVYGTDAPFNWPDTLDLILEASYLSDEEKIAIVGGNLMELLRIEA
ncbi:MAG: amidohydrolase family protein [Rhodospirillaceae bacterium]|nr:amidohydrolase family protein [Rhodospirillaceae bacterium]MDD9996655.1 amidohydrolase family protein [Rhodospirillaceae bacterium]MDE0362381.1 amidohydrolase family protein [Rhodospirillaceae bacterium]